MKSRNFVIVTAFVLLAGCFVLIAQDEPNVQSDKQKIGDLEQEVTELQNEIRGLQTGTMEENIDDSISIPKPVFDSGNGPEISAPTPNSVYSVAPPTQRPSPAANVAPQFGYNQVPPVRPWAVVPPTHVVPTPVVPVQVPVQVPVFVESSPCWVECGHVYEPYFPPAVGLNFWFSGSGNPKHKKHKH